MNKPVSIHEGSKADGRKLDIECVHDFSPTRYRNSFGCKYKKRKKKRKSKRKKGKKKKATKMQQMKKKGKKAQEKKKKRKEKKRKKKKIQDKNKTCRERCEECK